ncbi:MAG: S24/S26 family peptidase, partial [Lentisphaeraceae bacterium]|nr:S24/S26 family peptidase [Lentisphaeraceae bacterium]
EPEPVIQFEVAESSLPYLRQQVSAGNGVAIVEERFHNRPDMHFMDVHGESMEPTYKDGQKILVQLFQQRVTFGENHIPMEVVKAMIPENTVIIYERNEEGLSMKRVKYEKGSGKEAWYLKLTADNEEWAREVKFKRIVRKTDNFIIYGKVLS